MSSNHPNSVAPAASLHLLPDNLLLPLPSDNSLPHLPSQPKPKSKEPRLPVFLVEPKDGFVIKARPAQLNCSVIHSEKVTKNPNK